MTDRDLTAGIIWFSGKPKERQILTPETAAAGGAGPEARKKGRKTTRNRLVAAIAKHLKNCGGIKKGDAHETRKNLPKSTLARIRNIALTADRFSLPANRQCQQIKKGERP
jgi:hypothetical protein